MIKAILANHIQLPSPNRCLHRGCVQYIQDVDNLAVHIIASNRNSYINISPENDISLPIFDKLGVNFHPFSS
jgi:hypothetical protein